MPVYALVLGKNGGKFKESPPHAAFSGIHAANGRNQNMRLTKAASEMVADEIQNYFLVDRPVLDQTGLTGSCDIKLEATTERMNKDQRFCCEVQGSYFRRAQS